MYEEKPLTWARMYSDLFRDFQLEPGEIANELGLDEADFNKIVKGTRKPDEKETGRFLKFYLGRYKRYEEYKDPDRRRDIMNKIMSGFTSSEQETETSFPTKLPGKGTLKKGPVKEKKRPAEKEKPAAKVNAPMPKEKVTVAEEKVPTKKEEVPTEEEKVPVEQEKLTAEVNAPMPEEKVTVAEEKVPAKEKVPVEQEKLTAEVNEPVPEEKVTVAEEKVPAAEEEGPVEREEEPAAEEVPTKEKEVSPEEEEKRRAEQYEIAIRALSDEPSEIDLLRFSHYADALADFIKSENTGKRLTIGIDAPWGMGKTTLMKMVRKRLDQQEVGTKKRESHPTVWFNAWKYDQEESLWAALALEILTETRTKLSPLERCRFWITLNRKRVDWGGLLRRVVKSLACVLGLCLLGVIVLVAALLGLGTQVPILEIGGAVGGLGVITALYTIGKDAYNRIIDPFDLKISKYVHKPSYEERIGFLAEFEEDFKRVINVVTNKGRWPLVVFIDDLDRCAPPKPVEIIEAINILLRAEYCIFVIGMDAETVAGSIEAKYKDLRGYLGDASDPGGLTLGQRFLEKIVQINFRIPKVEQTTLADFVKANLDVSHKEPKASKKELEEVAQAEKLIKAEQRDGRSLEDAVRAVQALEPNIPTTVIEEAQRTVFAKSFDDSREVREAIGDVMPYLGLNPRKMKRFINLFRLQALIANRRGLLDAGAIELPLLAKWVVIATRWPDFVHGMMAEEGFADNLLEAYRMQERLDELEQNKTGMADTGPELHSVKMRIDTLAADPRIKRLLNAGDLLSLLRQMTDDDIKTLPRYLYLAQTTTS